MPPEYDRLSRRYQRSKGLPFRVHSEMPDHLALLGDVRGLDVLDLACGEGFYTRRIKDAGADRVEGVDLSSAMVDLARDQEARDPKGIAYHVSAAEAFRSTRPFDVVAAAFLLNCAPDVATLRAMAQSIADNLKPGGRFVTTNSHLCDHPEADYTPYAMVSDVPAVTPDGTPYGITFLLDGDDSFSIVNYTYSAATYESALRDAGLTNIRWHAPTITDDGLAAFDPGHWNLYLSKPPLLRISAEKR
ncbi:MAG: hypothetical protein ABS79_07830 [Planctomycetes bacterium SCN 63-9]|nr:MAG: hypothetical protein ABS79_07830 [Planctomycetes bacterium SCN 63-9]